MTPTVKWAPMLASPAGDLPPLRDWTLEPKWDGIRVIAEADKRGTHLWSRNGIDKASQFEEVTHSLNTLALKYGSLVLDGELVAIDRAGKPLRFQSLQNRGDRTGRDARTALVAFDILSASGQEMTNDPWTLRRQVLEAAVPRSSRAIIRRGESHRCGSAGARKMLDAARDLGWEGIILKRTDSIYQAGKRSPFWRKVKFEHEQEFVIGGYRLPAEGADREHFGALLVGYYEKGKLRYAGKVGTGYTRATLKSLGATMARLQRGTSPFVDAPRSSDATVWITPSLVAQIRYNEMTESGILRQPVFLGLRDDKDAASVNLEPATSSAALIASLVCGD